jgi:hypothetical protein
MLLLGKESIHVEEGKFAVSLTVQHRLVVGARYRLGYRYHQTKKDL